MKRYIYFLSFVFCLVIINPALAEELAVIKTSGIFIKDKLVVLAFDDPDIKGITCYVTSPKRALSFTDQTDASISCRQIKKQIQGKLASRQKIFKQKKNLFFKSMFIDRIYDKNRHVLIYVSYTKKTSGDNANNSISVVPLF